MTVEDSQWVYKNKAEGKISAVASLGLIMLWNTDEGLTAIDRFLWVLFLSSSFFTFSPLHPSHTYTHLFHLLLSFFQICYWRIKSWCSACYWRCQFWHSRWEWNCIWFVARVHKRGEVDQLGSRSCCGKIISCLINIMFSFHAATVVLMLMLFLCCFFVPLSSIVIQYKNTDVCFCLQSGTPYCPSFVCTLTF